MSRQKSSQHTSNLFTILSHRLFFGKRLYYYSSMHRYHYEDERSFNSSEEQLLHFLERTRQPGWRWNDMKQPSQPPEYSATNSGNDTHRKSKRKPLANSCLSCANGNGNDRTDRIFPSIRTATPYKADKDSYYCDRDLLLSLVFDAKVTQWFANPRTAREETGWVPEIFLFFFFFFSLSLETK